MLIITLSISTIYTNFLTLCVFCSHFLFFSTECTLYTYLFPPLVYVGQKDGRLCSESPGDGHPLLLPAGELGGQAELLGPKPQDIDDILHKRFVRPVAVQFHRQHDVFIHIQHRDQVVALEHKPDLPAPEDGELLVLQPGDVPAVHPHFSRGGPVQSSQHVQEGGFPAAGGAHDGHELPQLHGQVHPVQRLHQGVPAAVIFLQLTGLQYTHMHCLLADGPAWPCTFCAAGSISADAQ